MTQLNPSSPQPGLQVQRGNEAEAEIRQLFAELSDAIQNGRLDDIMTHYSNDIVSFDMMPPLKFSGADQYRTIQKDYFIDYFEFPVKFEFHEQTIVTNGELAFVHYLTQMDGKSKDGIDMAAWIRTTSCLQKGPNGWKIVHEHNSVPTDPDSGLGLMNLSPDDSLH